jgi:tetratricopeptide (TPR) repeat protein
VELVYSGDAEGVRRRSDEALGLARNLGDLATLASVLAPRYNTIRGDPGTLAERLDNTAELLAVAEQLPDPALRCQAWGWRAIAALEAADKAEADRCFDVFIRLARELQQPTMLWYSTYLRAARALHAGQFEEAERLSVEAFRLGVAAGHPDAQMFLSAQQVQLAFERGTLAGWEDPLAAALERQPHARWFLRTWQALLLAESHRDEEAAAVFEELAANDFADFSFEPIWLYVLTNCALVCAHLGDERRAAALIHLISPYEGQLVTMSSLAYTGAVSHYLGLLWRTVGDRDAAERSFRGALELHERMGAPVWLARTRVEWAALLLDGQSGDRSAEGAALGEAALTGARALGAGGVERRAAAVLAEAANGGRQEGRGRRCTRPR